jgi:proline dehydrogenase
MQEFNKLPRRNFFFSGSSHSTTTQPLVYGTYQAYLHRFVQAFSFPSPGFDTVGKSLRTPMHLFLSLQHARKHCYALGVKLVRGAYHPHEIAAHPASSSHVPSSSSLSISPDPRPPVWPTKAETDLCFDTCASWLIDQVKADTKNKIPTIGILFGTHNWNSCRHILDRLVDAGVAVREGGIVSMKEEVTDRITLGQLYGLLFDHRET